MDARHPRTLEAGLFLLIAGLPLAFTPFTMGPFADPKIVLLALGTLLVWLGGVGIDRRLAWIAAAWVAVTIAATVLGVDPTAGLVPTAGGHGGGALLVVCCAVLFVCGAGLPRELVARARSWLVWTGVAISVLLLLHRLAPGVVEEALPKIDFIGATLGNQLYAAAFLAAALAAAVAGDEDGRRRLPILALMTAAVVSTGERSSLLLPAVALGIAWWRAGGPWRRTAASAAVVIGTFVAWQVVDPVLPGEPPPESAVRQLGHSATDPGRFVVWRVTARAWTDRPVLGWGPGATFAAYLHEATPEEVDTAGRAWHDAHDIVLETGLSTGILGAAAVVALLAIAAVRALRSPRSEAWAVGAAAGLGAYALVEPLNLVLTSLLFLVAGMLSARPRRERPHTPTPTWARAGVAAMLGAAIVVTSLAFAASTLERRGYDYGEPDALRTALRLQPWRLSAREELAIQLAARARAREPGAAEAAASTIADGIEQRPWDPDVRITAVRVATLLDRPASAAAWLADHIRRFPGDRAVSATLRTGDASTP